MFSMIQQNGNGESHRSSCPKCTPQTQSSFIKYLTDDNISQQENVSRKQNMRTVSIVLLNDSSLPMEVDTKKTTAGELFDRICSKLQLKEHDLFSLAYKHKNEYHFIGNEEKLGKYISAQDNSQQSSSSSFFSSAPLKNLLFKAAKPDQLSNQLNSQQNTNTNSRYCSCGSSNVSF